jgi:hypothetical protein
MDFFHLYYSLAKFWLIAFFVIFVQLFNRLEINIKFCCFCCTYIDFLKVICFYLTFNYGKFEAKFAQNGPKKENAFKNCVLDLNFALVSALVSSIFSKNQNYCSLMYKCWSRHGHRYFRCRYYTKIWESSQSSPQQQHGHGQGEHHHQVNVVQKVHVDPRPVVLVDRRATLHTRTYILCRQGHTGLSHRSDKIRLGSSLK